MSKEKHKLFEQIKRELETHAQIEESAFYPELEKHEALKDSVLEAYEEYKLVKTSRREIVRLVDGSEKFDAKRKVLKDNVEHHVEEEEGGMFPKIRTVFSGPELKQLGQALDEAKKEHAGSRSRSAKS